MIWATVSSRFCFADCIECLHVQLQRRPKTSPKKRNVRRQSGWPRRPYKHWEKKRSEKQKRKGKIYPVECRFQRTRPKKGFLSEQCKEIQENNRMGKTRDLFKKTGDIRGTFHAKMGTIKERNGKDLTEAEEIKKKWQEYTEELYQKSLKNPDNSDGMVTHLEPDILGVWSQVGLRKHYYE